LKTVQEQVQAAGADRVNEIIALAKKAEISKSEAIRRLHAANLTTWAISKVLTAGGVAVSPQFANNVLSRPLKKG
jgi:hypothetical protein